MATIVTRRSARAVLLDGPDLLVIKRTRPGEAPYWVTIGGGVEPEDSSLEAAVRREVLEEIGARIKNLAQVLVLQDATAEGIAIQHLFLAEIEPVAFVQPTGCELTDPHRGSYELERVSFTTDGLGSIELKPPALSAYLMANCEALRASLGYPVMGTASNSPDR